MVILDDPRVASRELHREPYDPVPLSAVLRMEWKEPAALPARPASAAGGLVPAAHLRALAADASEEKLLSLLEREDPERKEPGALPEDDERRAARILERGWAAEQLGEQRSKTERIVKALELQVLNRSLHKDWMFHGLDGAMAARALGALGATESAPVLIEAFRRVDPALAKVADPRWKENPRSWTDIRKKMYILPALGDLPCPAAKQFPIDYLALDEKAARELAPPLQQVATRSLFRQTLVRPEIKALLRHRLSSVRGTAILDCLDHLMPGREAALNAAAPRACDLPRARKTNP